MNVTFACPQCQQASRVEFTADARQISCGHCGTQIEIPIGAIEAERVHRCFVCPSTDLFVRKDFPQRIGVGLVAIGILGSSVAWAYGLVYWTFGILFATALADVLLYTFVGEQLMCYRCHAEYRGVVNLEGHQSFNLETHERHRQLTARLKSAQTSHPSS